MKTDQLSLAESGPLAATDRATNELPLAQMLSAIVEKGVSAENMAVVERMMALYERQQEKDAEKQFNAAFCALQSDLPVIVASSIIPNRGRYEKFEDVMRVVGPLLVKHGFSVSFTMDFKENRILETCHLRHIAGHAQSNSFAVRSGKADSDTQADCKAATTAKRNALLNCLNIVIRQDALQDEENDASIEGSPISWEQAETLREMVKETRSDEAAFLRFAQASKYEEIMSGKYDLLFNALDKKRTAK
jgi:hypothetical protein